jgi:hypothetical protein
MTGRLRKFWDKLKGGAKKVGHVAQRIVQAGTNFINNHKDTISAIPGIGPAVVAGSSAVQRLGNRLQPILKGGTAINRGGGT